MANRRIKSKEVRERVGGISRDTLRRCVIDGIVPKPLRINVDRSWVARFDQIYEDIEELRRQYALTKQQIDELRVEIEELKRSTRFYPKIIWAKLTGYKFIRATSKLVNTPEGRAFLFQLLLRALGMGG